MAGIARPTGRLAQASGKAREARAKQGREGQGKEGELGRVPGIPHGARPAAASERRHNHADLVGRLFRHRSSIAVHGTRGGIFEQEEWFPAIRRRAIPHGTVDNKTCFASES